MSWLILWGTSGSLSVLIYALVSYWFDRHFVTSTWIKLWLAGMVLLGPLGALLTCRFLIGLIGNLQSEVKKRGLKRYPRPKKIHDAEAQSLYIPLFATRRLPERHLLRDKTC